MPRLFFALWPDDCTRLALAAHRDALAHASRGRAMRPDTLHMTLVFAGNVDDLLVPTLLACGDRVRAPQFSLALDRSGYFERPKVAWLGCAAPAPALATLQQDLRAQVLAGGFMLDNLPFHPHVTLVRNARIAPASQDITPMAWPVESFVLVHSNPTPGGPMYRVLKHWALDA